MELLLQREKSTLLSTPGILAIASRFECFTLEDPVRQLKIYGQTAIPAGRYVVTLTESARFHDRTWAQPYGGRLPLLNAVPGFDGVRIHPGNTAADTLGCVLVGLARRGPDQIANAQSAFHRLMAKLLDAEAAKEPISILIRDYVHAVDLGGEIST